MYIRIKAVLLPVQLHTMKPETDLFIFSSTTYNSTFHINRCQVNGFTPFTQNFYISMLILNPAQSKNLGHQEQGQVIAFHRYGGELSFVAALDACICFGCTST